MPNGVYIQGDMLNHMFAEGADLFWEKRLRLTWENLLALTRNFAANGHRIVVDFMVENELPWIREKFRFSELGAEEVRYIVSEADTERIIRQLEQSGDPESLERSLLQGNKLCQYPLNAGFFLYTSRNPKEKLLQSIKTDPRFILISSSEEV